MVRLGIVGIGLIAESHIELIANGKINDVELVAFSSRNTENMERVKTRFNLNNITMFNDYEEMLLSGLIDAVIICTPHYNHPQMAKQALKHQIHVLIEKPIGVYGEEANELIKLVNSNPKLKCGVLYNRRLCSTYKKVKEMIEQNAIGEMKRVNWIITNLYRTHAYYKSSPWRGTYKGEGGGLLMTQASHQLDLLQWICGMPSKISASCHIGLERDIQVENDVSIIMEYRSGATGQFIASAREFPGTNRLEIIGNRGQIIIEDDNKITYHRLEKNEKEYSINTNEYFGKIPFTTEKFNFNDDDNSLQHAALINNFIKAVKYNEEIICQAQEAMNSLVLINASYLSSWLGKSIEIPFDYRLFTKELEKRF